MQMDDPEGVVGTKIGKELGDAAVLALRAHILRVAPLVLPLSQKLAFAVNLVGRKVRISCFELEPIGKAQPVHTFNSAA